MGGKEEVLAVEEVLATEEVFVVEVAAKRPGTAKTLFRRESRPLGSR